MKGAKNLRSFFYDGVVIGRMEKMNGEIYELTVPEGEAGTRLDLFLAGELSLSRSRARSLLDGGAVTCEQVKKIRPAFRIQPGQVYRVEIPEAAPAKIAAQDVPFGVVYEDADVIVVNKPAGVVVHPGAGRPDGTLVNGLMFRYPRSAASEIPCGRESFTSRRGHVGADGRGPQRRGFSRPDGSVPGARGAQGISGAWRRRAESARGHGGRADRPR